MEISLKAIISIQISAYKQNRAEEIKRTNNADVTGRKKCKNLETVELISSINARAAIHFLTAAAITISPTSQIVYEPEKHKCLKMLVDTRMAQAVALARVDLQVMRLIVLDELGDEGLGILEVYVLVNQAVNDQEAVFAAEAINR